MKFMKQKYQFKTFEMWSGSYTKTLKKISRIIDELMMHQLLHGFHFIRHMNQVDVRLSAYWKKNEIEIKLILLKYGTFKLRPWKLKSYCGDKFHVDFYYNALEFASVMALDYYRDAKKNLSIPSNKMINQIKHYFYYVFGWHNITELKNESLNIAEYFLNLNGHIEGYGKKK